MIIIQSNRLANCTICGKLYYREHTDYCLDCYKKMEQEFKKITDFLKVEKNRLASIEEVSTSTGVAEKRIADFIRDGRIYIEDYPNLRYGCAHCGTLIKRQILCKSCSEEFTTEINKTLKTEQLLEDMGNRGGQSDPARYRKMRN